MLQKDQLITILSVLYYGCNRLG